MRGYTVRMTTPKTHPWRNEYPDGLYYTIYEYEDGTLAWRGRVLYNSEGLEYDVMVAPRDVPSHQTVDGSLFRFNSCCFTPVSDREAELLTGLCMPAAMDRLRELVHES